MPKRLTIIFVLCCLLIVSACTKLGEDANKQPIDKSSEEKEIVKLVDATEDVQSLYSNRCLNCHAIDLSGKMGERTNLQLTYERLSYDEIVNVISNGRNIMPAFEERLTEQEINELAKWLSKQ